MNYYITNEEYAEISAKLDASLENMELSDSEEVESNSQALDFMPVSSSIADSENWKKFLDIRNRNELEQQSLQEKFSETLTSLREATHETKFDPLSEQKPIIEEIQELDEESQEEVIETNTEISTKEMGIYQEALKKNHEKEKEEEDEESQKMAEEELLSKLYQDWIKRQAQVTIQMKKKEVKRIEDIDRQKREREEYIKDQEMNRIQKENEKRIMQQEIQEQNRRKQDEVNKQVVEQKLMKAEDILSSNYMQFLVQIEIQKLLVRECKMMEKEDLYSLNYRNLIPYTIRKRLITEFSEYPLVSRTDSGSNVKAIQLQTIKQALTIPTEAHTILNLVLPKQIQIEKIPFLSDDKDIEIPSLSNFFPYPLDPHSKSLEVKHEDIKSISGLSYFTNLKVLILSLNRISRIQNLPGTLSYLDLSQNAISSIPDLKLPYLEELILDLNQIESISGLASCTNLRILSLNNNKICKIGGLENCKLLERILLYRNKIKEIQPATFNQNNYIIYIDLGRNKLRSVNFLEPLKLLKSLILYQNMIGEMQKLILPLLQELWLNGNSLKSLDFIENAPLLETLRLEDNTISSVIPFQCPLLKYLNVSFNNLGTFSDVLKCIKSSRSISSFSFNDNPLLILHPELLPLYSEIIVKALPLIQELNNTPRTSLQKMYSNKAILVRKSFELHQLDLFSQRIKRKNEIVRYVSDSLKLILFQLPTKVYLQKSCELEFNTKDIEYYWYQARMLLHRDTKAALIIQTWWKYRLFTRYRIIQKYKNYSSQIIKVQSVYRGWKARRSYSAIKYNPRKILKIQAAYRGYLLRKNMKRALENAKFNDLDLDEFKEVNLDDIHTDYDFNQELIIPKNLDLAKFLSSPAEESKTPRLPPLKPSSSGKSNPIHPQKFISHEKSIQNTTQSSLPPLNKNKAKEDIEKHLNEWGFINEDVKEALQYRMIAKMKRKNKGKQLTADEKLERFRKTVKK